MLYVTDQAKEMLKAALLANRGEDRDLGIRLLVNDQGEFGLVLDHSGPDDLVVEHSGLAVLLIDPGVAEAAGEAVIDYREEAGEAALVIEPHAA
ncbi:MAG: hypothetical protein HY689_14430 [Chloroflexi bacterium]|nr:hypothetical protein [Chloroflexota bacterium]